jgi:hypothetical protein
VSPVKYELSLSIPEDAILLSHRLENLRSYIGLYSYKSMHYFSVLLNRFYYANCSRHFHNEDSVPYFMLSSSFDSHCGHKRSIAHLCLVARRSCRSTVNALLSSVSVSAMTNLRNVTSFAIRIFLS